MEQEFVYLVFGLALAGIYGLLALGLVVTYRMSKFVNLAHGALGMLVTYVFWQMSVGWGWPLWLSLLLALFGFAPLLGVVVSLAIYRPLLDRDDSAKIAGSIVTITLLTEIATKIWGGSPKNLPSVLPTGSFSVGSTAVGKDRVAIIIAAAALAGLCGLLLARTRVGVQMRAVAENRQLASTFGTDVTRIDVIGWAVATSLAGVAGIFISALSTLNIFLLTFLVVSALAAAAVGRLVGIAGAMIGAVAVGLAQTESVRLPSGVTDTLGTVSAVVPFLVLVIALAVLLIKRTDIGGGSVDQTEGAMRSAEPRQSGTLALPRVLRAQQLGGLRFGGPLRLLGGGVVLVGAALAAGSVLNSLTLFLVTSAVIWVVVFASISMLNGLGGQVSLCQASFMGVGALAASRVLDTCVKDPVSGAQSCESATSVLGSWLPMLVAPVAAGLVGLLVGALATRLRGIMLAVATLSFGFFLDSTVFPSKTISGGEFGLPVGRPSGFESPTAFLVLCTLFAAAALVLLRNIGRSGTGRVLRLCDQSPDAAAAFGIRSWAYKLGIFALSAGIAGGAGYLLAMQLSGFAGGNYGTFTSLILFMIAYAVGTRRTFAPLVAGVAFIFVPKALTYVDFLSSSGNIVFALGTLLTLGLPGGLMGWLALRREHRRAAVAPHPRAPRFPPSTSPPSRSALPSERGIPVG